MTLLIDLVFPRFKLLSGAERAILGLATALAADGHRIRVVCHQFDPSCRPRLPEEAELVCTSARLDWSRNRYLNAAFDYLRCLGLKPRLDSGADLCVLFGPALPLVASLRTLRANGPPVLYYCWEPPRALYQDRDAVLARLGVTRVVVGPALRLYAVLDRWLVRLADSVCTSSPFAVARVQAVYDRSATVITLGIDRARLDAVSAEPRRQPPVVLTVNYLHPRKRVDLFVEAAAAYRHQGGPQSPAPQWVVVGDGPERRYLETLAERLGVADIVTFAGFVPDDQLPRYYATATCYVHTGVEESFGLSVIEASYARCPVVAVDEGGVRDTVVDGSTGYLVSADPAALASSVHTVLGSEDQGRSLGHAGHERVAARYRWSQGAADMIAIAETLAS